MESKEIIERAIERLYVYCKDKQFKGYDPYDALNSRLCWPFVRWNRFSRQVAIQLFKRLPFNLRQVFFTPKGYNPKGLGLFLSGLTDLCESTRAPEHQSTGKVKEDIRGIAVFLGRLAVRGYGGEAWGYNFPWQSRAFYLSCYTPSIVVTSYIGNAFLDVYELLGKEKHFQIARSACDFILKDLNRTNFSEGFCFSYSPFDHSCVYNASVLGARFLLRVSQRTGEKALSGPANEAIDFVVSRQNNDGSWFYGEAKNQKWIDSFHTGFILESLKDCLKFTGRKELLSVLEKGMEFYRENFFVKGGICKFYHNRTYPIDIHSVAQAILTFVKMEDCEQAKKIAFWAIKNMQDKKGYFYFQKHRFYTNRIPYIRWGQAWMFYALAKLVSAQEHKRTKIGR